ncbi:hypothetical protein BC938DRAFT_479522 [Jimgerdemannia flammicorona]|uniref:Uncharacterized protein n=1 Tax=Jimgerdemannia flammicorona TaxID=994334 RepID=A0A433QXT3_9FUNG|nr:hypothetical protein BC938DRAFT_479522 [Jimgerdemannia flammicorona]
MSRGIEQDGANNIERETHENASLVTEPLDQESHREGHDEISAEVRYLQERGFQFVNAENILEVLVKDVEKTVGKPPQEEKTSDQNDGHEIALPRGGDCVKLLACDSSVCHCVCVRKKRKLWKWCAQGSYDGC